MVDDGVAVEAGVSTVRWASGATVVEQVLVVRPPVPPPGDAVYFRADAHYVATAAGVWRAVTASSSGTSR